jgi:hypothetical protein
MEHSIDPKWRKASYSGNGGADCLEAGSSAGTIMIRDTKLGDRSPVLRFGTGAWRDLTDQLKAS